MTEEYQTSPIIVVVVIFVAVTIVHLMLSLLLLQMMMKLMMLVWCGVVWFKAFHASILPPRGKTTREAGVHVIFVVLLVWHCSITVVIVLSLGHNIAVDEG